MGVVSCGTTMLDQGVFENIGSVTWDTIAKTSGFTAVSGNGYFCNTTSAAFTVTLPSSPSAGDVVGLKDYANTADTNNITIDGNGSNIQGAASNYVINTEGRSVILVYVDATKGWLVTGSAQASNIVGPLFVTATGGTITCCGDYKIHTFTGPGTFTVTCAGNAQGSSSVDYLVVAGGGGGGGGNNTPGGWYGGGGGAGGYRESSGVASGCYSRSPLGACVSALPITVQGYPITVGGGGSGGSRSKGSNGNNSVFSTITSTAGGGGGGCFSSASPGNSGGSGGGGNAYLGAAGSGNTPPVSPPQGNNGGAGSSGPYVFAVAAGGGGGATATGTAGTDPAPSGPPYGGPGGAGATSSINATPTTRAGGGGGSSQQPAGGSGGSGGGGAGANNGAQGGTNATTNTGSGGGGGNDGLGGSGGSGIVIIRYKYQ